MRMSLAVVSGLFLVACGASESWDAAAAGHATRAASIGNNDAGTRLSIVIGDGGVDCIAGRAAGDATIEYTVTSTGAADAAQLTAIVDGGAEVAVGEIPAGRDGWVNDGRNKVASGALTLTLADGTHSVVICAEQHGALGRLPKRACSAPLTVTVDCRPACNQGVGNGAEGCDPGNSNNHNGSNDENGGTPGNPGRRSIRR